MNSILDFLPQSSRVAALALCLALILPNAAIAQCSEEEMTAIFFVDDIFFASTEPFGSYAFEGIIQTEAGKRGHQGLIGLDLPWVTESYWQVDTFNCANLDLNTPGNHAWWCGTQFESCNQEDPPEGYGNSWSQWLGWHGTVPDPSQPVTVTVRAKLNLDSEPGYDFVHLQYIGAEGEIDVWSLAGFAEGLTVEQTFTVQPEDYTDPFDTVHLRWTFRSDGGWSDEDCLFPSAGAAQIDLIEVYFDQGTGPIQMGYTETCEPGSDLQWEPEVYEPRLSLLDVVQLGEVTNPSIPEMIMAVEAVQPRAGYGYEYMAQAGPFYLFYDYPSPDGGSAIVDTRDGRVIFAGTFVSLGFGSVSYPVESSHWWSFPPGVPAGPPASVEILPNPSWSELHGSPHRMTDSAVDYLSGSDVLRSFSNCGDYEVVSYIYIPIWDYGVAPHLASMVVIVSGKCGPPWADFTSAAPQDSSGSWLGGVFPNPFNPQTTISFSNEYPQHVCVEVFDIRGHRVSVLTDRQYQPGAHSVEWHGRDSAGRAVPSGEYFFRVEIGGQVETRKAMLLR